VFHLSPFILRGELRAKIYKSSMLQQTIKNPSTSLGFDTGLNYWLYVAKKV